MGTDDLVISGDGEGPARKILLQDFALEVETVTVRRFAEFGVRTRAVRNRTLRPNGTGTML
ncbi:formylglycine-generating enzyme family protein [Rhizobium sp. NFR07]|uniref:formylglycine-generating enzyme family protein n=1 Tax=Rhizobium sp. NFR07 TaxID=1566262 RepID=UPI00116061C4|nr:formylglycine-generating enzyme family protein [Rhizobium sp. NFR07]